MAAKRILYIEDNFQNQRLVKKILNAKGYEMLEADDGLKGVALAMRERPDLILMDINIPGIDGMEATTRLKSSELSSVPIIALTANAMRGDRERIIAAGCDEYLQKPIQSAKLLEVVRNFIGLPEGVAEPPAPTASVTPTATVAPAATPASAPAPTLRPAALTGSNGHSAQVPSSATGSNGHSTPAAPLAGSNSHGAPAPTPTPPSTTGSNGHSPLPTGTNGPA